MQESEMSNDGLEISIQEIKKAAIEKKNKKSTLSLTLDMNTCLNLPHDDRESVH